MIQKRRIYKTSRPKYRSVLLGLAVLFLLFFIAFPKMRQASKASQSKPEFETLFGAANLQMDTPYGLPQLERQPAATSGGEAEDIPSGDYEWASESSVTAGELSEMLKRFPITGITIKADENADIPSVTLKNETKYAPDFDALLKAGPSLSLSGNDPQVLIFHTHTSEAYTPTGENSYTPDDNDRTADTRYNVVRVGDEIEKILNQKGIKTVHVESFFDRPSYTGCYTRSLDAVAAQLKKYPSIKVVIDVHRDAMITSAGVKYKTVTTIDGKSAAQIMFVCGTDAGGLSHPNWRQNLAFAALLQQNLLKEYPSLMRPINLRAARFNQHTSPCAMLVEIGTCGNTLEEAVYSASLFADTLSDTLQKYRK